MSKFERMRSKFQQFPNMEVDSPYMKNYANLNLAFLKN